MKKKITEKQIMIIKMKKVIRVRSILNLSQAECSAILFNKPQNKSAYDLWFKWENGGKMSSQTESVMNLIITIKKSVDNKSIKKSEMLNYILMNLNK